MAQTLNDPVPNPVSKRDLAAVTLRYVLPLKSPAAVTATSSDRRAP